MLCQISTRWLPVSVTTTRVSSTNTPRGEYIQAIEGCAAGSAKPPGAGAPSHTDGDHPPLRSTSGTTSARTPTPLMLCRTV